MDLVWRIAALADASSVRELTGGHQSRAFVVERPGGRLVAKVRNVGDVDRTIELARAGAVDELAAIDPWVCGPVPVDGELVTTVEADGATHLVSFYDHVEGREPDPAAPADAELMGRVLARLHATMASLDRRPLPLVAALRTVAPDWDGPTQLLHGDWNAGNLRVVDGWCRVLDFDDCGYGPPAFDVANAILMVRFDDATGEHAPVAPTFEAALVAGYQSAADTPLDLDEVRRMVDLRVDALERWLDEPATAPVGIRTAPPEWHTTLRSFVTAQRGQAR